MAPLDFASAEPPRSSSELGGKVVASLRSGEPFTCLLIDAPASRSVALETVLGKVADSDTRVLQISNPLRSALTLERLFIQAVGPELDFRFEYSDAHLAKLLARPHGTEKRLLIVIHQPETLDAEAIETLERMAPLFPTLSPKLQILFCGPTIFVPPIPAPAGAPHTPDTRQPTQAREPEPEPEPAPARARTLMLLGPLLLLIAASAATTWREYALTPAPAQAAPSERPVPSAPRAPPPTITVRVGDLGSLGHDAAAAQAVRPSRL